MSATIVVVGSLNMDLVMRMTRAPVGGETLPGHDFAMLAGGKGANQAVACARMGASVAMVGRVGIDANGDALKAGLAADGVDAREVKALASTHTGVASIWVEDDGQNRIVLASGANGLLDPAAVARAYPMIDAAEMLIAQLEVPMSAVQAAVERAHRAGVPVLMNPAPAAPLPDELWAMIAILVVNETEAATLSGLPVVDPVTASAAGHALRAKGPDRVICTLGGQGCVVVDADGARHTPARAVKVVDTTAAGDTFIGALAVALCEGQPLDVAVAFGQAASALCVTRRGAQVSIPYRRQVAMPPATSPTPIPS
jgi:ribokinase